MTRYVYRVQYQGPRFGGVETVETPAPLPNRQVYELARLQLAQRNLDPATFAIVDSYRKDSSESASNDS